MSVSSPQNLPLGDITFFENLARHSGPVATRDLIACAPQSINKEISLIAQQMELGDTERVREICHALKGACYAMQAQRLAYYVRELELSSSDKVKANDLFRDIKAVSLDTIEWWDTVLATAKFLKSE